MSSRYRLVAALFTLLVCLPLAAWGQSSNLADKIQAELDQTDQWIERTEELLQGSDNAAGLVFLEQAKQLQQTAKDEFAAERYAQARKLTLQARDLLRKAAKIDRKTNQDSEQGQELVLQKLERAGDKLDRAAEVVYDLEVPSLVALYESARDNLQRAWEFYDAQQYAPALKLADMVEQAADRILDASRLPQSDANYERRRETVRQALDRAKEQLADCASEKSHQLLEQAEQAFTVAEELAAQDRSVAALQALQRAREMVLRATRECRGAEDLQTRYNRLVNQADQLKERSLTLSGDSRDLVDRLLVQAYEQLELAREHMQANDLDNAQAALQAAQLTLRQAEAYIVQAG